MDEDRHPVLRPFPKRKSGLGVEELAVPTRRDQKALEAERPEAAFPFGDMARVERIERAQTPAGRWCKRHDRGVLVVDVLDDIDRRLARDRCDDLGRKWIANDPAGDAGLGANLLLEIEIRHLA